MMRHTAPAISLLMLIYLCLAESQNKKEDTSPDKLRQGTSAPVSSFFSELGDLILDVDKTIAEQSRPKIEHEANVMSQLFRPGSDYFNRIQDNYKEMQKRLGKLIGNTIGFKTEYNEHELSTISPPPENFNPTIGPDYNPFAAAAEARKEKLKQRISKESFEPRSSIPKTIDESLKAFGKLSQAILDDIGEFSKDKPSKSVVDKESPKRTGDIEFEECDTVILEDPDLEQRRQDMCSRIAAEKRARENLRKLMKEPKRVTGALFPKSTDALENLSKGILERSGDVWTKNESPVASSIDFEEECSNEVLEDPDLEKRRQEKCSNMAAEIRVMENIRNMMLDPKRATETLFSKNVDALDKISKGIIGRSGDVFESGQTQRTDEDSEADLNIETSMDQCSGDVLEDASLEKIRKKKCARIAAEERLIKDLNKILQDTERETLKWFPVGSETVSDPSVLTKRNGDGTLRDSPISSLDKQIRQLIKDHGSWILDYPLFKRWRQRVGSSTGESSDQNSEETQYTTVEDSSDVEIEPTEFYLPVSNYDMAIQKSGDTVPVNPHESAYYRIVNQDGDSMEEELDFVLDPESLGNDVETIGPKETVILAFTSDGVPLKLRLGPEVDNPIQYLHKVLQSAGVSLNVPVEAYDDLEPVGKEVLKLGSGILTRAVLIDASNPNELKSLLKALMVSRSTGKTTF